VPPHWEFAGWGGGGGKEDSLENCPTLASPQTDIVIEEKLRMEAENLDC
jgi:hypothetical protein